MNTRTAWFAGSLLAALRQCALMVAVLPGLAGAQPLACSPAQGGAAGLFGVPEPPDCAPGEAASVPMDGPSTLAGNPVDVVTGAKLDRAIDAYLPGGASIAASPDDAAQLVFSRFYASDSAGSPALGPGWRMGLDARLYASTAGGERVLRIVQGDGREIAFGPARHASAGRVRHEALVHRDGVLESAPVGERSGEARWTWRWRNGRRLVFDADGRLVRIVSLAGPELALAYDAHGRLASVRSASGQAIGLRYYATEQAAFDDERGGAHPGRLAALLGSEGPLVRYRYDRAGRLARVELSRSGRVAYEYADGASRHLAAVVLPDGRRSAYRYTADGRVDYSRGAGDADALALRFEYRTEAAGGRATGAARAAAGVTTVRVGDEVRATYRWVRPPGGSAARLLSASGPGCPRCPDTGRRYRYDPVGRLVGIEVAPGRPGRPQSASLSILRDRRGRPLELRWGAGEDRRVRIAWRADPVLDLPERIDRPSVMPELRAVLRPAYDGEGRTVALEHTGHSPLLGPGDAQPRVVGAVPVRRVSAPAQGVPGSPWPEVPRGLVPRADAPGGGDHARLWRDDFGRAVAMHSRDAGLVRRHFDEQDRLRMEERADGAVAHYGYDAQGRLVEYAESRAPGGDGQSRDERNGTIRLAWSGPHLARIEHAEQRESLSRDDRGRVVARHLELRLEAGRVVGFETRYAYDADGRLSGWSLPGGGWVRAVTDASGQAVSLEWQPEGAALTLPLASALRRDARGLRRAVLGNGVVVSIDRADDGSSLVLRHRTSRGSGRSRDVLHHRLDFDRHGRLVAWSRDGQQRRHLFDARGQLLQAVHRGPEGTRIWRFAYDGNGNRLLAHLGVDGESEPLDARTERLGTIAGTNRLQPMGSGRHAAGDAGASEGDGVPGDHALVRWDAAGRVTAEGTRTYRWDASGRLREVRDAGQLVARYRYNARGERIAKVVDGVATHFLYDAQRRLLAELDADGTVTRQYVYLAGQPLAVLDRVVVAQERVRPADDGGRPPRWRVRYLHLNHLGAPEAVTDEQARVIWRGQYAPFGRLLAPEPADRGARGAPLRARPGSPAFELALRLPGQYEDAETGLHYNDHRYYDPDAGRYLSPDPIGPAGGPNPYVYAGNDPLTKIDPSGLLLFAFDGTGNSDLPPRRDDWSNVYKLSRSYADGRVWYMSGVGTHDAASGIAGGGGDSVLAGSARSRVDHLLRELDAAVLAPATEGVPIDVDVIGFSRGAAMARDFSNRVADRIRSGAFAAQGACVRLRFLGLWDTVAQFGADGIGNAAWRLAIPAQASYAAHAVALNEHRTLFPAESIVGSPLAGVRIERGFVGAHSDVGGSYAEGDLSDVALIWMHAQAQHAGVRLFALTSEFARVTAPLLHDSDTDGFGDREFRYRNSWGWTFANPLQRVAPVEGLRWRDTGRFIRRFDAPAPDAYGEPTIAGDVDIAGYSAWLRGSYGITVAGGL